MSLDQGSFDPFVTGLDYPVYVVTVASGGQRAGCLVGFATQVSIDPPRLLVCLSVRNHTYRVAQGGSVLAVHALGADQLDLARLFGEQTGDELDKFPRCLWHSGPEGVPILENCARWMVGRIIGRTDFGDHVGHLLDPLEVEAGSLGAVLTLRDVANLTPGHGA